jgi:hypothetical protein
VIVVRLTGGLGNQMFQYAFGRKLAIQNNTELELDTSLLGEKGESGTRTQPAYSLDIFDFTANFATTEEVARLNGIPGKNLLMKIINWMRKIINPYRFVVQNNHDFEERHLHIRNNYSITGRWQSERYFTDIEDVIRKDFTFKRPLDEYATGIARSILGSKAIAIHVRRGDYLSDPHFSKVLGVLSEEYYSTAIRKIEKSFTNPEYYVFSDDLTYCKKIFEHMGERVTFVDQMDGNRAAELDMRLMTLCKGHIISNSTYSWWGAWLSVAPGKIVFSPKMWARDRRYNPPHIIPDSWVVDSGDQTNDKHIL